MELLEGLPLYEGGKGSSTVVHSPSQALGTLETPAPDSVQFGLPLNHGGLGQQVRQLLGGLLAPVGLGPACQGLAQRVPEFTRRGVALEGFEAQGLVQHRPKGRREARRQPLHVLRAKPRHQRLHALQRQRGRLLQARCVVGGRHAGALQVKGVLPRQQLRQDDSQREDIRARVQGLLPEVLRRGIGHVPLEEVLRALLPVGQQ